MTSMMNPGPLIGPYLFAASVAGIPSLGNDAVFPVLIAVGAAVAVVGLAHPMRALTCRETGEETAGAAVGAVGADGPESAR